MTCESCLHYEACKHLLGTLGFTVEGNVYGDKRCDEFQDKSRFVELPCKIGDTVFDISEFLEGDGDPMMYESRASNIEIFENGRTGEIMFCIDGTDYRLSDFGEIAFTSREAAEEALKGEGGAA